MDDNCGECPYRNNQVGTRLWQLGYNLVTALSTCYKVVTTLSRPCNRISACYIYWSQPCFNVMTIYIWVTIDLVIHLLLTLGTCAERVMVVVSCVCLSVCVSVCMYVCLSEHAILAVRAVRSITKDAIVLSVRFTVILKRRFSLNCLIRKLERFSLTSAGVAIFS